MIVCKIVELIDERLELAGFEEFAQLGKSAVWFRRDPHTYSANPPKPPK
jgi:hypothetical protein